MVRHPDAGPHTLMYPVLRLPRRAPKRAHRALSRKPRPKTKGPKSPTARLLTLMLAPNQRRKICRSAEGVSGGWRSWGRTRAMPRVSNSFVCLRWVVIFVRSVRVVVGTLWKVWDSDMLGVVAVVVAVVAIAVTGSSFSGSKGGEAIIVVFLFLFTLFACNVNDVLSRKMWAKTREELWDASGVFEFLTVST